MSDRTGPEEAAGVFQLKKNAAVKETVSGDGSKEYSWKSADKTAQAG